MNVRRILFCGIVVAVIAGSVIFVLRKDRPVEVGTAEVKVAQPQQEPDKPQRKLSGLRSPNMIGYVPIRITKGKRVLSGRPFLKTSTMNKIRLGGLSSKAAKGDMICWSADQKEFRYEYDGKNWRDSQGGLADEIKMEFAKHVLTYERTEDVTTEMIFFGELDMAAAPGR